jgi:glutaredoxin 3
MVRAKIYTTDYCGYCHAAKSLLHRRGIAFEEIDASGSDSLRKWLVTATGQRTVPQIFLDDRPIGGYRELSALDRSGKLTDFAATTPA